MLDPDFLLLDEPAPRLSNDWLSNDEIARLAELCVRKEVVSACLGG